MFLLFKHPWFVFFFTLGCQRTLGLPWPWLAFDKGGPRRKPWVLFFGRELELATKRDGTGRVVDNSTFKKGRPTTKLRTLFYSLFPPFSLSLSLSLTFYRIFSRKHTFTQTHSLSLSFSSSWWKNQVLDRKRAQQLPSSIEKA